MIENNPALQQLPGRANPIFLEGRLLPLRAETAQALNLRDAQVVQGQIQVRADQPMLVLRGTALPLPPGWPQAASGLQWLQVKATAQGWFLQPTQAPGGTASSPADALVSRLNALLFRPPGQADMTALLASGQLPRLVQSSGDPVLQQLWQNWPLQMQKLQPEALARAVAAALGAEVWLGRGLPVPGTDPRAFLRKLMGHLRERLETLEGPEALKVEEELQALQSGLDHLESQPVQAAQAQAQNMLLWQMTLPFADAEPVELEFRRPPRQGGQDSPLTVNVHTQSQALGELWLRTTLHGLDRLDLMLWAVRQEVAQLARARGPELGELLSQAGLQMQSLQVVHGARPASPPEWVPSGRGLVVDLAA